MANTVTTHRDKNKTFTYTDMNCITRAWSACVCESYLGLWLRWWHQRKGSPCSKTCRSDVRPLASVWPRRTSDSWRWRTRGSCYDHDRIWSWIDGGHLPNHKTWDGSAKKRIGDDGTQIPEEVSLEKGRKGKSMIRNCASSHWTHFIFLFFQDKYLYL